MQEFPVAVLAAGNGNQMMLRTLSDIYGDVSEETLDSLPHRGDMSLAMKHALRDAHFHPQKTLEQFRADMLEYGVSRRLHMYNGPRDLPEWAVRAASLPPHTLPHEVYQQYPDYVIYDEGW